jgi:hypothetical protein
MDRFTSQNQATAMSAPDREGNLRFLDLYLGGVPHTRTGERASPQAFLAHLQPDDHVRAHFHRVDQYQVFFGAPGALFQRTEIPAGTVLVQYADAYSTYGPFSCAEKGLDFFTLRAFGDNFTAYMPGSRHLLSRRRRRIRQSGLEAERHLSLKPGEVRHVAVFDAADGVLCCLLVGGPEAMCEGPSPALGGGQYICIIGGEAVDGEDSFGAKSIRWVSQDTEQVVVNAGPVGVSALVMQFPREPTADLSP